MGENTAPIQSADLSGIIERLEKAMGPDREVDAQIWLATTPGTTRNWLEVKSTTNQWPPYIIDETRDADGRLIIVPAVTTSVDAAIALAERVLPGWGGLISLGSGTSIHCADLWSERRGNQSSEDEEEDPLPMGEEAHAEHACLPIAIVLATLRALQSKGEA
ncbi:MAG: hypothetical protein BGO05_10150 [Rhizobiales bacterium 63-7]|nr:hypothetical protein [Hyphomicrobiales bacterium]OJU66199.1 MAG: hypothetical protein BGO05_10150 [Rhizobiales bacterium 63-7]